MHTSSLCPFPWSRIYSHRVYADAWEPLGFVEPSCCHLGFLELPEPVVHWGALSFPEGYSQPNSNEDVLQIIHQVVYLLLFLNNQFLL